MVIAKVGDYEILDIEYQAELKNVMDKMHLSQPNQEAKERAIAQLIDGYLLLKTARESDVDVCPDEIENRFLDYTLEYEDKDQFKKALLSQKLDEITLRSKIKDELLVKKYLSDNFKPCDHIAKDKLIKIYEEHKDAFTTEDMVRASHILVKGLENDSYKKILKIRSEIKSSDDFLAIAKHCSDCPSSCHSGDLGFFGKGKMVKEFEDIAFTLEINEISEPIKTQFGYHLIMVTDKKESKLAKFEEVKEALTERLKRIDSELKIIRELKRLRAESDITIHEELL